MLARRLNGKYIAPEAKHLTERVKEIQDGLCSRPIGSHHGQVRLTS